MSRLHRTIARIIHKFEAGVDAFKYRLRARVGHRAPITLATYRGFGTRDRLSLKGRVLRDASIRLPSETDSRWRNLLNTFRRFESDEVPGARVLARFGGVEQEVVADEEGYFDVHLTLPEAPPADRLWHPVALELLAPEPETPVRATGRVLIPAADTRFGVISDIDDTVVRTGATDLLQVARIVLFGNARTRLPFKGVAAFYRALHAGVNPIFYVSSSPWNLYDLLVDFFDLRGIPLGPIALRDYGITRREVLPIAHRAHKLEAIRTIVERYPDLPFVLIGDSGQQDPEIYREVVDLYPERILAVYIRSVDASPERVAAVRALAEEVAEVGSTLVLADDTLAAARHAAEHGWISPQALPDVRAEKAIDEAPATPMEKVFPKKEQAERPPLVIEERDPQRARDAVERALDADDGDTSTTIVVESE